MRCAFVGSVALSLLLLSACNLVLGMDALDSGGPDSGGTDAGGGSAKAGAGGISGDSGGSASGGAPVNLGGYSASGAGALGLMGGAAGGPPAVGGFAGTGGSQGGGAAGSGSDGGNASSAGAGGAGATGGNAGAGGNAGSAGGGGAAGSSGIGMPCLTKSPDASCSCAGYGARDYWFCTAYLTFDAAEKKCKAVSMHLPKVESQGEDSFLFKTAAGKNLGEYYLGAIDAQYSHWSPGQPDGSGACIVVQNNGPWDDRTCFDQRKYICESARPAKL